VSLHFSCLGTSSAGNCIFVENSHGAILVDCGLPLKRVVWALQKIGRVRTALVGGVYTHGHKDHCQSVHALRGIWRIPVGHPEDKIDYVHAIDAAVKARLEITAFAVPHDVAGGCYGYRVKDLDSGAMLGVVMDAGMFTAQITAALSGCHALVIGVDFDEEMLQAGDYRDVQKDRILSPTGHFGNRQAKLWFAEHWDGIAKRVVAAHLSRTNNRPEMALSAIAAGMALSQKLEESDALKIQMISGDTDRIKVGEIEIDVSAPDEPTPLWEVTP
jgi:phosphoribosyl 1,2-cyclic phosphodiesterase